MKTALRQLRLIIWKNYLSRKRQKIRFTFEIIWPLFLFLLLMWVRTRGLRENVSECNVSEKILPTAGLIPFVQNWFCTVNNTCFPTAEGAKLPPGNLTFTRLRQMVKEIQDLYLNKTGQAGNSSNFPSLFDAFIDATRMASISQRLSSPNYTSVPAQLATFLFDLRDIPAELSANKVELNKQEQLALFGSTLSNATYNFSPYTLLLNGSSSVECENIPANLSDSDRIINQRLCELRPNETKSFREVLNKHWNSSINKELASDFIRYNMEERISFEDLLEANNAYKNLTRSSQALPKAGEAFGPDGASNVMMLAADASTVDQFFNIFNKYLCGRTMSVNDSILPDTKLRIEEFKEKYRLKQTSHYIYDNQTSKTCNSFFQSIEVNPVTRLFWRSYKHLILGQILYTPVTPMTERIMRRVNETYFQMHIFRKLVESAGQNSAFPASVFVRSTADSLNTSRNFLNSSAAYSLFPRYSDANSTEDVLLNLQRGEEILRSVLNGRDAMDAADNQTIWDCFEYNKVRGIKDPLDAVEMAEGLMEFNRLWALIVFDSETGDYDSNPSRNDTNQSRIKRASNTIHPPQSRKELVKDSRGFKNESRFSNFSDKPRANDQPLKPQTIFRIRMSSEFVDNTEAIRDRLDRPSGRFRPMVDLKYLTYGFAYLQDIIEKSIISEQTGVAIDDLPGTMFQQYPYPCYIDDQFIKAISRMFPLFMVLAWIFTCSMIVKSIVYEKELRLKQTMQVMGLRNYVFWIGWYIDSILPMLLTIFILTLVLTSGKVLIFSDPTVVFMFLFLYSHCTIFLSFLISVFFDRANIAAACAGIIFFILFLPYPFMVRWILYFDPWLKASVSLLSNVALGLGAAYIAEFEEQGVGIQWSNVNKSGIYDDDFNLAYIMIIMVVDCILYALLTWYIEGVFPGQYGIPHPWYFPFSRSYWLGKHHKSTNSQDRNALSQSAQTNGNISPVQESSGNFEPDPPTLNPGVQIQNLTKVYSNGKVAVQNLSMNFYEGQITSFLGHNGAGKTTTISILTGLYPPTSGTALICGYDIRTEISMVRKSLGMCPQHNVLFHRLTVLEHLKFYGFLRGSDEKLVEQEFEQMVIDLDLPDKRQAFPDDLSGGMQRKLSIALAFIGGSKVVILDEPTSGVDPYSRRSIWELLLKYKKGRTVILTTHYMDEADLLGDRIGIISKGAMKCCGTSLFLKNKYGSGFTLTVELKPETPDITAKSDESSIDEPPHHPDTKSYDDLVITKTVKKYVPNAIVESKFGNEIIFVLPTKDSKKLESLCSRLDDDISRLNAISYGVSDTSLEEIFLRITDDDSPEEDKKTKSFVMDFFHNSFKMKPGNERSDSQVPIRVTTERVEKKTTNKYVRQYFALHSKRYHHTKRDFKALFSELVLPPVLVAVALAVLSVAPRLLERPPLELTPVAYGDNLTFFAKDETPGTLSDVMRSYRSSIYDELGLGTTCLFWNGTESPCDEMAIFSENPNYKIASCSCKTGAQICPDILDDPPPPYSKIVSGDYVYSMDNLNTSKWVTSTIRKYALRNLGGFEFGTNLTATDEALVTLKRLSEFGLIDPEIAKYLPDKIRPINHNIKVWFNNKAWMASVANLNAIHNNILRVHAIRNGTKLPPWQQYGIVAINHPLRFTTKQMEVEKIQQSGFSLLQAISVIFALSFVTASFLLYLIEERISNAKHLQLVSGVNRLVYWVQAYCWDLAAYTLSALLCIFVFLMFDSPAYTSKDSFAGFVLLFFLYGWSCIPMMYPASFIFNVPSSAFVAMGCGNMFIGIITTITTSVLQSFPDEELRNIAKILSEVFLIFPHFCLGDGMIKLSVHHFSKVSLSALDVTIEAEVFEWNFLGKNMFCMFVLGIVFFLLTLAIEYNVFRTIRHYFKNYAEDSLKSFASRRTKAVIITAAPEDDDDVERAQPSVGRIHRARINFVVSDTTFRESVRLTKSQKEEVGLDFGVGDEEDVALERKRVYNNPSDLLIIKDLTKKYRRKATPSVNKVCIGVKRGECFGLLGLNGAGKTTTFKMLTGAVKPSSGDATVGGFSINGASINDVRALLGYCPQFDALDPLMTPYEHLVFYARIRNIPSDILQTRVDHLIKRMALGHYRNRLAGDLSGGNKRKLSTGIALLGNPPLVFLDEPTTGMDPKARRFLWTCISDIVKEGGCVILTSHSMEECQALCTRLTIMVNGQFTCLGSSQHLKNKYGKGYLLIIRCAENSKDEVKEFMRDRISSSKITEEHFTQLRYEVPQSRLSDVLKELETAKSRNIVVDYSVTQTTLEEVFLRFAREQADPDDRKQKKNPTLFDCCMGKGYKSDKHVSPKQTE